MSAVLIGLIGLWILRIADYSVVSPDMQFVGACIIIAGMCAGQSTAGK